MSRAGYAIIVAALACLGGSGCVSFTAYKTAKPLREGASQVLVAPQLDVAGPAETGVAPLPELALGVRYGQTDTLELGGNMIGMYAGDLMKAVGFEFVSKLHVYGSDRIDLAVGAGAGYRLYASSGTTFEMVHASVPFIMGLNLGDGHQLVLSPTLAWQRWYATGAAPANIPSVGASLGFRWQISRSFALLPEVSWAKSGSALAQFDDLGLVHAGIAAIFGEP